MQHPKSADLPPPPTFSWGNWLVPPDPTGQLKSFLISVTVMASLLVGSLIFTDQIFGPLLPSNFGRDSSFLSVWLWLLTLIVAASAGVSSVGTLHLRIDRVEVNPTEVFVMFSHIPKPLGRYVTRTAKFHWKAVGPIAENDEDDGEGGHTYSIKIKLVGQPPNGGASAFDLSMDGANEMHRAMRRIRATRGCNDQTS